MRGKIFSYLLKYFSIFGISFVLFKMFIHFSDYCTSVYDFFIVGFLFLLFILNSIILYSTDLYRLRKRKLNNAFKRTNWTMGLLMGVFCISSAIQFFIENNRKVIFELVPEVGRGSSLTLYDNDKFEILLQKQHGRCYYRGRYIVKSNNAILLREDIVQLTDSLFVNTYYIGKSNSEIKPNLAH